MAEQDRYIPGVPCWVDTNQPDPDAAARFYSGLFGWEFEDVMPPDAPQPYLIGRLAGGDAAAVGRSPDGSARWNTYIWVESAEATAQRVRDAGGAVLKEPFDVLDQGRMAVVADPEGAAFCLWEPRTHRGARVVNEHGGVNFNGLVTRDPEGAKAFYRAVFGWETLSLGGGEMWTLPGYGDFLESIRPGTYAQQDALDAPRGFADVVASLQPLGADDLDTPAHWSVTFGAADADEVAAKATALGGELLMPPTDVPWSRMTIIRDPQGATFIASQFVPANRDIGSKTSGSVA